MTKINEEIKSDRSFSEWIIPLMIGLIIVVWFFNEVPARLRQKANGQYCACCSFTRDIGVAIDLYKDDNGYYPANMAMLKPKYLKDIPTCPAAGKDTYSRSYVVSSGAQAFTVYCNGSYHSNMKIPMNYPQYDSHEGMIYN